MLVKCIVYSELIIGLRAVSIYMCFDIISIELMFGYRANTIIVIITYNYGISDVQMFVQYQTTLFSYIIPNESWFISKILY